jgi:hypothetical protein
VAELVVFRDQDGKLAGFGEKGRRAYSKFKKLIEELEIGETLQFSYRRPRSPQHHRFFFARMNNLLDRQERFTDLEHLLEWLKVGAGHCELMPGRDGVPVAIPKSIAWHLLEEQEFIEVHRAIVDFLWSPHAAEFLWPHLSDDKRYAMVDQLLRNS